MRRNQASRALEPGSASHCSPVQFSPRIDAAAQCPLQHLKMSSSSHPGPLVLLCCAKTLAAIAVLVLTALTIISLIHESNADLRAECQGTTIWSALLSQLLVLSIGSAVIATRHADGVCVALCAVALMIGVCTWALTEATSDCARDKLRGSNVRTFALVWSGLLFSILVGSFLWTTVALRCAEARTKGIGSPKAGRPVLALDDDDEDDGDGSGTVGPPRATDFAAHCDTGILSRPPSTVAFESAV